jgi:asparagine synthase (glutamine-hydrolysing)
MCGICGILNYDKEQAVNEATLLKMRDVMVYRGPDDAGILIDKNIGLGHRRLSIIDLQGGHQPLSNEDGSVWIVFNGEIYNYQEHKKQLESKGHRFRTRSDTETIVHLYEEYGPECVQRLNGIFAFAIWDANRETLFLARDHLGIKPLYYYVDGGKFLFASEIKALLEHPGVRRQINESILEEFLFFRYVAGEDTFFKNIHALLPGHYLLWKDGRISIKEFWSLSVQNYEPMNEEQCLEELEELISDAISLQLMSEVPIGTACSGGVDSSLVSAYAAKCLEMPLETFCVGFEEAHFDETRYARLVANAHGTKHHEIMVTNNEFSEALPKLIWHNDEPLNHPNSIQTYYLNKYAKEHVTVMLTGEGGDELFGGYPRYLIPKANYYYRHLPARIRAILKTGLGLCQSRRISKLSETLDFSPRESAIFASAHVSRDFVEQALGGAAAGQFQFRLNTFDASSSKNHWDLSRYMNHVFILDLRTYLVSLLNRQDKMSMAASIECRVPLLDYRLVELSLRIPLNLKIKWVQTKFILKKLASRVLPREVVYRRKSGFGVPLDEWLRNDRGLGRYLELIRSEKFKSRCYFDDKAISLLVDKHTNGVLNCGELLWELINFEIWARTFIDR